MLGTVSLAALVALGFLQYPWWVIAPFGIVNSFIGLHFPAGKAQMLRERGQYWQVFLSSLPLQFVFAAIVFGLGYGLRWLLG